MFTTLICIIIAYVVGSLNSAILVAQAMKLEDPRKSGSKNPGATNMLRLNGKQAAGITLAGDILKGLLPVWLAALFGLDGFYLGLVAIAAVAGHIFPVFYEFQGGKGVATTIGATFGLLSLIGLIAAAVWAAVAYLFRISSMASLAAVGSTVIMALITGHFAYLLPLIAIAGLVAFKHMDNIERLRDGSEPKIGWLDEVIGQCKPCDDEKPAATPPADQKPAEEKKADDKKDDT